MVVVTNTREFYTFEFDYADKLPSTIDTKDNVEVDKVKTNLETATSSIAEYCANQLIHLDSLEFKEVKELAKIVLDITRTLYPQNQITINNNTIQNISNTQLNYFKQGLKNEI